jgi:hypothetical protein
MPAAGIGGAGYMALTFETVVGTYLPPTTAGTVFIPILSESVDYNEDKYLSEQIRQSTIESEQKPGYYHIAGDVTLEVDTNFLPYILYCSRHVITKTGAGSPWLYKFVPSTAGSTSTAASGAVQRTCSLTFIRNGVGFGYGGCTFGQLAFSIDTGNLRLVASVVGQNEQTPAGLGAPAWVGAKLLGADAHSIYLDAAGTAPAFAAAAETGFNGFSFTANYNAEAQNRIRSDRSASYVRFAKTEAEVTTELDFLTKTDFNSFKSSAKNAIKLESIGDATPFATSTDAVKIQINNSVFTAYSVNLASMDDLVMANATYKALGIAGGDAYAISVQSAAAIT